MVTGVLEECSASIFRIKKGYVNLKTNLNKHLENFKSYTIVSLLHCSNLLFITTKLKSYEEF